MPDGRCIIVCRTCSTDADMVALIPFASWSDRGKWASEHTRGTGHASWLCLDGGPSPDEVREILHPTKPAMLPPVDDLALMLAVADRLWCEDTGDERGEPVFWQSIAARLDRIVRGDLLARALSGEAM